MENLRTTVSRIVASSLPLEQKIAQLKDLKLTKSDIQQLLYKEIAQEEERKVHAKGEEKIKRFRLSHQTPNNTLMALAIRQPWATLVASGIKDVELRDKMIPPCDRFLVVASKYRERTPLEQILSDEQYAAVKPYLDNKTLPPLKEWPTGAIIGWVDIAEVTYNDINSSWALGHIGIKYVLKNAHMFNQPIYEGMKATPIFYKVDNLTIENLPPSRVVTNRIAAGDNSNAGGTHRGINQIIITEIEPV